jgi:predicted enzyme related to lactoylglutathione lyase
MAERDGYEPGTPSWVDLTTPHLDGALQFYGGLFGWEFEDAGEEAGHYHMAHVRGKRVAGLGPAQEGAPPFAYWTTYLAGSDVDEHAAAIGDAGGRVLFGPLDVMGQGRMVVAQDPEGAAFGIWQPQAHTGSQLANENATFTWNERMTRDIEGTKRFYGAVFGHTFEDLLDTPASTYQIIKVSGHVVGGMFTIPDDVPPEAPPQWLTYFQLDDVDAGFERVRELGGRLLRDPVDSPYGRYAPVQDPQGAAFCLIRSAFPDA